MSPLRIPGSAQRRANGSAIIDSLHLSVTCNAVCDVCGHGRNSKEHKRRGCSRKRQRANSRAEENL